MEKELGVYKASIPYEVEKVKMIPHCSLQKALEFYHKGLTLISLVFTCFLCLFPVSSGKLLVISIKYLLRALPLRRTVIAFTCSG